MPLCLKCKVELIPINLHDERIVGAVAIFNGAGAILKGLSRSEGFVCPECPEIYGYNGRPEPERLIAFFEQMINEVHIVKEWKVYHPLPDTRPHPTSISRFPDISHLEK